MTSDDRRTDEPRSDAPAARRPDRRSVLRGIGALAVGGATVSFVSACAADGSGSDGAKADPLAEPSEEVTAAVTTAVTSGSLAVGQASFLADVGVVVTRPAQDTYHAFSNVCPHAGGRIDRMNDGGTALLCPLHGSEFDPATGAVVQGPATSSLPGRDVKVAGGKASFA